MSNETEGTTAPAPTADPSPATPPAAAKAPEPAPKPATADPSQEPTWLPSRLEQAKRSAQTELLKSLGVEDVEKAKAALAAAAAAEEANKSAEQRAAEASTNAQKFEAEAARLKAVAQAHADNMLRVLTESQQAAVKAIAGDDPAAQLNAIGALAPTWGTPKPSTDAQAAAEAAAKPATTAPPAGSAPAPSSAGSPPDHKAVYSQLREKNPFEAAVYGLSNPSAYDITT